MPCKDRGSDLGVQGSGCRRRRKYSAAGSPCAAFQVLRAAFCHNPSKNKHLGCSALSCQALPKRCQGAAKDRTTLWAVLTLVTGVAIALPPTVNCGETAAWSGTRSQGRGNVITKLRRFTVACCCVLQLLQNRRSGSPYWLTGAGPPTGLTEDERAHQLGEVLCLP